MATAKKLTYEDYASMPDDGKRYEVIDGELHVLPTPFLPHQRVLSRLSRHVFACAEKDGGDLLLGPLDVILSPHNVVQPDLMFVAREHASRIQLHGIVGAPDIAIEILGDFTRHRDEVVKRDLYERFRVPEYWIVDPDAKTVKILRREIARYETVADLHNDDTFTSPTFPDLQLPLATIFA
jgi:Uma2 family endonuclease